MNDNWYKDNSWYKPLETPEEPAEAAPAAGKPLRRKRRIYLSIFLAILGLCCIFIGIQTLLNANGDKQNDFDITGELPEDFHDFLDNYYTGTTGTAANVKLPQAEDRGSLTLKAASAGTGSELSLKELYESCSPSVVYIRGQAKGSSSISWGSGIVLSDDGYVITNTHVIEDCDTAEVGLSDGSTFDAVLIGADSVSDLAILKIDAEGLTPAVFAADVSIGDEVVAIGNPLGETYKLTMTDGIISAINRTVNHNGTAMNLLQTNAAINEGNSGGPLFNRRGQVVGITNMKVISALTGVEGIGFAIPTVTVKNIVSSIMSQGAVFGRSTIGITIGAVPDTAAAHYNIPTGLYICAVAGGSDAQKQGVKAGDILTKVNGEMVKTTEDVAAIKNKLNVGDTMHFDIWRDGKSLEFDVKLIDANDIYNK